MKLYNTLTNKKEEFVPQNPNEVTMYACGPTVYNYFHIGNARPFLIFDALRKYLEYRGYKVKFVQNFTDIDDKIINRANAEGVTYKDISEKYIEEYFKDAKTLGISPATIHPRATENIDAIVEIIQKLIDKGHAYKLGGDVYFRTRSFEEYGKLSKQPIDDLETGARVDVNDDKENPLDFALWKSAKEGEPYWKTPFGKGRPGWHIECSAMANRYLGETVDIHGGGQDLVFPHHENEIAQSEAANGCQFARFWLHNGYINVDNVKMSKSLNNFFMTRDAVAQYGADVVRFFMLSAHYKSPVNYSADILEQAKSGLDRLYACIDNLNFRMSKAPDGEVKENDLSDTFRTRFCEAMDDDFNTADGIAVIFELVRHINTTLADNDNLSKAEIQQLIDILKEIGGVLNLFDLRTVNNSVDTAKIEEMIAKRTAAKAARDFKTADAIRDELKAMGVIIEDTPQGVKYRVNND
jgi:cysteinyl-tRNA synthetase